MKLLVIGGTIFLGRHFVEAAVRNGHDVTIFHRGTHPSPFPNVREILGDRMSDLALIAQEEWDAVIDTCAYVPEQVEILGSVLKPSTTSYLLVSTISVYNDLAHPPLTEDTGLATLSHPEERAVTGETYGALKVLCEQAAVRAFGAERMLIVRPGLIVGPFDPSGRFTYWVERIASGGEVIVPGSPTTPTQWIDVRDLTAFMVQLLEDNRSGIVHVTGPLHPLSMQDFLRTMSQTLGSNAEFIWASEKFLSDFEDYAMAIPFWVPDEQRAFMQMDLSKAVAWGLTFRAPSETVEATWKWTQEAPSSTGTDRYLNREQERELLMSLQSSTIQA